MCMQDYIFLWPIPHKHMLAPCVVNLASISVLVFTCHIWVEKIKRHVWTAEAWHLDCTLVAALPTHSLNAQKDAEPRRNAHHSPEQYYCRTVYCQDPGLVSLREEQRWMEWRKAFHALLDSSFWRNHWSIPARKLDLLLTSLTSERLLPFKAATKLFPIHPSFFIYPSSTTPQNQQDGKKRETSPHLEAFVMLHCILGSIIP